MGLVDKFFGEIRRMANPEEEEEEEFDGLEPPRAYERKERSERSDRSERSERSERTERSRSRALTSTDWEKDRARSRVREVETKTRQRPQVPAVDSSIVEFQASSLQQVVILNPKNFDEARNIADYLRNKITILLNMEQTEPDSVQRIVDFIAGVAYANDGHIKMINENFYLVTPFTVSLISEIVNGLQDQGIFYQT
ncbi:MAG: cell division protein SepF [Eubacteriales bacterium]